MIGFREKVEIDKVTKFSRQAKESWSIGMIASTPVVV